MYFLSQTEAGSGQEVSELKSQVTGLNDRITALNDQIDKLTGLVTTMQVKEESKVAAATAAASNEADGQKRRKLSTKNLAAHRVSLSPHSTGGFGSIPLQRQASLDSTMMIGEFEAAGEELPSGPDLMFMAESSDFFSMSSKSNNAVDDSLMMEQSWSDDMDILFTEGDAADVSLTMDSGNNKYIKAELPQASPVLAYSPVAVPVPAAPAVAAIGAAASDISSVLDSLSPELRLRFVDRLAEVMGAQLTQNISQQVQVNVQVAQQPQAQPSVQPVVMAAAPSSSYAAPAPQMNLIDADPAHFLLPSGCRAPEIALPLASAAIAALLSSMHTFAQNTHMQMHLQQPTHMPATSSVSIKEEVVCK